MDDKQVSPGNEVEEGTKNSEGGVEPDAVIQSSNVVVNMGEGDGQVVLQRYIDPLPWSLVARMLPCEEEDEDWDRDRAQGPSDQPQVENEGKEEEEDGAPKQASADGEEKGSTIQAVRGDVDQVDPEDEVQRQVQLEKEGHVGDGDGNGDADKAQVIAEGEGNGSTLQAQQDDQHQVEGKCQQQPTFDPLPKSIVSRLLPSEGDEENWDADTSQGEADQNNEDGEVKCQHKSEFESQVGKVDDDHQQVFSEGERNVSTIQAAGDVDLHDVEDQDEHQPHDQEQAQEGETSELNQATSEVTSDKLEDKQQAEVESHQVKVDDNQQQATSEVNAEKQENQILGQECEADQNHSNEEGEGNGSTIQSELDEHHQDGDRGTTQGKAEQNDQDVEVRSQVQVNKDALVGEGDLTQAAIEEEKNDSTLQATVEVTVDDPEDKQQGEKQLNPENVEEDPYQVTSEMSVVNPQEQIQGEEGHADQPQVEGDNEDAPQSQDQVEIDDQVDPSILQSNPEDDTDQPKSEGDDDESGEEQEDHLDEEMYEDPPYDQANPNLEKDYREMLRLLNETANLSAEETYIRILEFHSSQEVWRAEHGLPSDCWRGKPVFRGISRRPRNIPSQNVTETPDPASVTPSPELHHSQDTDPISTTTPKQEAMPFSSSQSNVVSNEPQPHCSRNPPPPTNSPSSIPVVAPDSFSKASSGSHEQFQPLDQPDPALLQSSLEDLTEKLTEQKSPRDSNVFIRSTFLVGDVRNLPLCAYKITSTSESVKTSNQARDEFLQQTFLRFSVIDDVVYSLSNPSSDDPTIEIGHAITLRFLGQEPSTSENFRRFFEDRLDQILNASKSLTKMSPGKWLFSSPKLHSFTNQHITGYNYVEVCVKVVDNRILASVRDGVFAVHTDPVYKLLPANTSQALSHGEFIAMSREKINKRTILVSTELHFNHPGWSILVVSGVRPQVLDGRVSNFRIVCGEEEFDPASCYLAGYSNWEVNDPTVYKDLEPILERNPHASYGVRTLFLLRMNASTLVQEEMRESGLTFLWEYLEETITRLPQITLDMRGTTAWIGDNPSHMNWTFKALESGNHTCGESGIPWSYVAPTKNRRERDELVNDVVAFLIRDGVQPPPPLAPIRDRSLQQALLRTLTTLQGGNWKPSVLMIFIPWNNIGPILPFVKIMLELYQINCIVIPPLVDGRVADAAKRIARTFDIKLGAFPWRVRDFPNRTMVVAVVSGMTKTATPRRVCAASASMGLAIANNISFATAEEDEFAHLDIVHGQALTQVLTSVISTLMGVRESEDPVRILIYSDESTDLMAMEQYVRDGIFGVLPHNLNPELVFVRVNQNPTDLWCQRNPTGTMRNVDSGVYLIEGHGFYMQSKTNVEGSQHPCYYEIVNYNSGMNLTELAGITYQACFLYYHDTEPKNRPAVLAYSQDSLVYGEHGVGNGITDPNLIFRFYNRS